MGCFVLLSFPDSFKYNFFHFNSMVFAPRRLVYPFFVAIFAVAFFAVLFLAFLSQSIEVIQPSFSVAGENIVLKLGLSNNSSHEVRDVRVLVKSSSGERAFFIKGSPEESKLLPNEKYDFLATIPLSESLSYEVIVSALFNKNIAMKFSVDEATINPVDAEVALPSELIIGQEYTYKVNLCNVSESNLWEVLWKEYAESGFFKEEFFQRSISLEKSQCKPIYSTLTPIKEGTVRLNFYLTVGAIEKRSYKDLVIRSD